MHGSRTHQCVRTLSLHVGPCEGYGRASREGVARVWVKAKLAVYMLLESFGRSPYRWEAPEGLCSNWDALHLGMCQVYWEREGQKR